MIGWQWQGAGHSKGRHPRYTHEHTRRVRLDGWQWQGVGHSKGRHARHAREHTRRVCWDGWHWQGVGQSNARAGTPGTRLGTGPTSACGACRQSAAHPVRIGVNNARHRTALRPHSHERVVRLAIHACLAGFRSLQAKHRTGACHVPSGFLGRALSHRTESGRMQWLYGAGSVCNSGERRQYREP